MYFNQLKSFLAICKYGSYTKAADSLFCTQPGISYHIKSLEKELGVKVFESGNNKIICTPSGEILKSYAKEILKQKKELEGSLEKLKLENSGFIEIHGSNVPYQTVLRDLICEFSEKRKNINFSIKKSSSKSIIEKILKKEIEYGFVGTKSYSDILSYTKVYEDNLVLLAGKGVNIKNRSLVKIIKEGNFVLRDKNSATRKAAKELLEENGIDIDDLKLRFISPDMQMIYSILQEKPYLSFGSETISRQYEKEKLLKIYPPENFSKKRSFYLAYMSGEIYKQEYRDFFSFIVKNKT